MLEGRPVVTAAGMVELWHPACWDVRDQPLAVEEPEVVVAPPPPASRFARRLTGVLALAAGAALVGWTWQESRPQQTSLVDVTVDATEEVAIREAAVAHEDAPPLPPEPTLEERFPIPTVEGVSLVEKYPSLAAWTHPVTAATELTPTDNRSRMFGGVRHGIDRKECGQGHCGVDLDGPRGRPIVAVAPGVVIRIERRELGADGRSGRYVRIQHDDGPLTAYMHLDEVSEELRIGDRVDAGHYLGTLGASAIFHAAPHLHFTLEVPRRYWERGDHLETIYLDPAPYLVRAKVVPVNERPRQPAS